MAAEYTGNSKIYGKFVNIREIRKCVMKLSTINFSLIANSDNSIKSSIYEMWTVYPLKPHSNISGIYIAQFHILKCNFKSII